MKNYYNDRLHVSPKDDLDSELLGGNDRSTIITIASLAEASLEALLGSSLPHLRHAEEKDWNEAFRHQGPFGTFSATTEIAFYLTLIDQRLREQMNDLRHLRNAVAHTKRRVTFEDVELQNVAKRLFAPRGLFKQMNDTVDGIRRTFIAEGLLISSMLSFGREEAIARCRRSFIKQGKPVPF